MLRLKLGLLNSSVSAKHKVFSFSSVGEAFGEASIANRMTCVKKESSNVLEVQDSYILDEHIIFHPCCLITFIPIYSST